jgi:hypothetical protein
MTTPQAAEEGCIQQLVTAASLRSLASSVRKRAGFGQE